MKPLLDPQSFSAIDKPRRPIERESSKAPVPPDVDRSFLGNVSISRNRPQRCKLSLAVTRTGDSLRAFFIVPC